MTESIGEIELRTAQGLVKGELFTHLITLVAEVGDSLDIEATIFISPEWKGPSFLGYLGVLDRLRFAIDPQLNQFFFGSLA